MEIFKSDVLAGAHANGIIGKVKIQKFDGETGDLTFEMPEQENAFFASSLILLADYIMRNVFIEVPSTHFQDKTNVDRMFASYQSTYELGKWIIWKNLLLSSDTEEMLEDAVRVARKVIAGCNLQSNVTPSYFNQGQLNGSESFGAQDVADGKIKLVIDFPTGPAGFTFQSVMLTPGMQDLTATNQPRIQTYAQLYKVPELPKFIHTTQMATMFADMSNLFTSNNYSLFAGIHNGFMYIWTPTGLLKINLTDYTMEKLVMYRVGTTVMSSPKQCEIKNNKMYVFHDSYRTKIYVFDMTNLSLPATEYTINPNYVTGMTGGEIRMFALSNVDPNVIYVTNRFYNELDLVLGVYGCSVLYKIQLSTGTILDRYLFDGPGDENIGRMIYNIVNNGGFIQLVGSDEKLRIFTSLLSSDFASYQFSDLPNNLTANNVYCYEFDMTDSKFESAISIASSQFVASYRPSFAETAYGVTAVYPMAYFDSSGVNKFAICIDKLDFTKIFGVMNQVVLPAPVTKLSTEVLKITYTLQLDLNDSILKYTPSI